MTLRLFLDFYTHMRVHRPTDPHRHTQRNTHAHMHVHTHDSLKSNGRSYQPCVLSFVTGSIGTRSLQDWLHPVWCLMPPCPACRSLLVTSMCSFHLHMVCPTSPPTRHVPNGCTWVCVVEYGVPSRGRNNLKKFENVFLFSLSRNYFY